MKPISRLDIPNINGLHVDKFSYNSYLELVLKDKNLVNDSGRVILLKSL